MRTQEAELTALEDRQVLDRVSTTRIVGGVAVAYAASVIVQNAWSPAYGSSVDRADIALRHEHRCGVGDAHS